MKCDSSSPPVRIVFNSPASYMGHSLNEDWAKGPDFVNNLYGIIVRFREYPVAIAADISKMYNSVRLSPREQHVRRYLWRDLQADQEPDHYVLTAVPFGDRPSGTIATVALHTIADMNEQRYPRAAKMIKENSYVDDLLQSAECSRDALDLAFVVQEVLDKGNLHIKHWIFSGHIDTEDRNIPVMKTKQVKILGIYWETVADHFFTDNFFTLEFNINTK